MKDNINVIVSVIVRNKFSLISKPCASSHARLKSFHLKHVNAFANPFLRKQQKKNRDSSCFCIFLLFFFLLKKKLVFLPTTKQMAMRFIYLQLPLYSRLHFMLQTQKKLLSEIYTEFLQQFFDPCETSIGY